MVDDIVNYEKALLVLDDIIEWHKEELKSPLLIIITKQTPYDQNIEMEDRNLDENKTINQPEPENQIVEMEESLPEDITLNPDENETINQPEPENQIVDMEEQNQK